MIESVFVELRFWLLVAFSVVVPACLYAGLLLTRTISRGAVLAFGVLLMIIVGVDVYLLQSLTALARLTPSLSDDTLFVSELSIALYVLPLLYGGIGVNLISHVLLHHLTAAEELFESEHPDACGACALGIGLGAGGRCSLCPCHPHL